MKTTDLITVASTNQNILAKMGNGQYILMESLHKICKVYNCVVNEVAEKD